MTSENNPTITDADKEIASVGFSCGRGYLDVADVVVAMEGDKCRHMLPEEASAPIPKEELERAMVGDQKAIDVPIEIVRFFRGQAWDDQSMEWASKTINEAVDKKVATAVAKREAEIVGIIKNSIEAHEICGAYGCSFALSNLLKKLQTGGGA